MGRRVLAEIGEVGMVRPHRQDGVPHLPEAVEVGHLVALALGGVGAPQVQSQPPAMSAGVNPTGSFIPVARIADLVAYIGSVQR